MAFADALEKATSRTRPTTQICAVVRVRGQLPPEDAAALTAAMRDSDVTGSAIEAALSAEGYVVKALSINRHRNLRCTCESV